MFAIARVSPEPAQASNYLCTVRIACRAGLCAVAHLLTVLPWCCCGAACGLPSADLVVTRQAARRIPLAPAEPETKRRSEPCGSAGPEQPGPGPLDCARRERLAARLSDEGAVTRSAKVTSARANQGDVLIRPGQHQAAPGREKRGAAGSRARGSMEHPGCRSEPQANAATDVLIAPPSMSHVVSSKTEPLSAAVQKDRQRDADRELERSLERTESERAGALRADDRTDDRARRDRKASDAERNSHVSSPAESSSGVRRKRVKVAGAEAVPRGVSTGSVGDKQPSNHDRIKVCVRKRPLSGKELAGEHKDIIHCNSLTGSGLTVLEYRKRLDLTEYVEPHDFAFDEVLSETSANEQVYRQTTRDLVKYIFTSAGKATVFAYGQTGAGKTFTMMGGKGQAGLYMLAAQDIFARINAQSAAGGGEDPWGVSVSFFEIYGGKLFDLLAARQPLVKREDGNNKVQIRGLSEHKIATAAELMSAIAIGHDARSTASTDANLDSSRSHAILQVNLRAHNGEGEVKGKMSFIDLAGSERAADTGKNGDRTRRLEAAEINKSLLALKECIRALAEDAKHIPFRGSVLTSVLKDSFIGNCRTVMIANVAPDISATEHTMNTLRYADRVKQIKRNLTATLIAELQHAESRKMMERPSRALGTRDPDRRRSLVNGSENADGNPQGLFRGQVHEVASAACRMSTRVLEAVDGRAQSRGPVSRSKTAGGEEDAVAEQLAALHKRHIYDTSVLLQKEREMLAMASRKGSSMSVSYLANLGKLLQQKAGMVTRLLSLLPATSADST